jgi:hypothetical protein
MVSSDGETVGREAIAALLRNALGAGEPTLAPDRLSVKLLMSPVVTIAPDGRTARGRWREVSMTGRHGETATWWGGELENEYVLEDGVWRIAVHHYYPFFRGPYETGWRNTAEVIPLAPYHYDPDGAGKPITPHAFSAAPETSEREIRGRLAAAEARLDALLDEGEVLNLQAAYGYYVDRRMLDDIADLFTENGSLEVCDQGTFKGRAAIRAGLEQQGPPGLREGQLNDHLQLDPVVVLAPDGRTASVRTIEVALTGQHGGQGFWGVDIVESRFVKDIETWKIESVRVVPRVLMDYAVGWAGDLPALPASDCPAAYPNREPLAVDFPNPAAAPDPAPEADRASRSIEARLADAQRTLAQAVARDGAENVSNAYGYYIDEFRWDDTADLFSTDGWKELSYIGTYIGQESVRASLFNRYGDRGRSQTSLTLHQTTQPYVTVSEDGQRAQIRERLFQMNTALENPGSYIGGTYENQAVLENGVWKIAGMDLDYIWLANYGPGWTGIVPGSSRVFAPSEELLARMAPDAPLRGNVFPPYPEITPMAFHFANPVSGREPEIQLMWSGGRER